jgi:hypothetical protein
LLSHHVLQIHLTTLILRKLQYHNHIPLRAETQTNTDVLYNL